ncbi:MAG: zinc ABC transporter substrate-binding protein [Chloroflexia bacterium]|nr:zinc ABC transporter substrate-binding protein [Chloroflexia bacterium]
MTRHESPAPAHPIRLVLMLLLLSLLTTACGDGGPAGSENDAPNATLPAVSATGSGSVSASSGEGPRIVATFSVLGDLVRNVAGGEARLTTLVGPGMDAHTFEPSPADNRELAEADLIFENGLEFETWLDDLYESSESRAERVLVTEGMKNLILAVEHDEEEGTHEAEEGHKADEEEEHGEYDPHVWHDVNNSTYMVERIRDSLAAADPENADRYRSNAERYSSELRKLDAYIVQQVGTLPEERRQLVTTHDTFGYFARRYGFQILDTALGITTEESEPSAGEVAGLIREIKAAGVPAVFAENVSNAGVMKRVAQETGAELAPPLYTDALGEPGSEGATYIAMERYNVTTIVAALKK